MRKWTPERRAKHEKVDSERRAKHEEVDSERRDIGATHMLASSEQACDPMAS
jgi:hypothetical protein